MTETPDGGRDASTAASPAHITRGARDRDGGATPSTCGSGDNDAPRVIDLFCGAGGASCGFWQGGATLVAGVDRDRQALETHRANLPGAHVRHDLRDVDPDALPTVDVDWVHGSPPCPGFSTAKGRYTPDDDRNDLVWMFVEWCDALAPDVVTMENVTGMATITDTWMDRLAGAFRAAGYRVRWRTLNAADYGVPQTRRRVFVVAVREDAPCGVPSRWLPRPTHAKGGTTTLDGRSLPAWRTVRESIGDLADIRLGDRLTGQVNEAHQMAGRRRLPTVDEPAATVRAGTPPLWRRGDGDALPSSPSSSPPSPSTGATSDGDRSLAEFSGRTDARGLPPVDADADDGGEMGEFPPRPPSGSGPSDHASVEHAPEVREKMARISPGENAGPVTESRLHPDRPSRTITFSNGVTPIHYAGPVVADSAGDDAARAIDGDASADGATSWATDSSHSTERGGATDGGRVPAAKGDRNGDTAAVRRLTIREVARLQSFGDWFEFTGTKDDRLEQIGNAVPPRLAQHIAAHVRRILDGDA